MPALLPDERELARRRQSLIVLVEPPGKIAGIALAVLLVAAIVDPLPLAIVLVGLVAFVVLWCWLNWRAEWVLLTNRRIIRVQGLPETIEIEAFLRTDRISGVVLIQSLSGKLLGYGTIHLEAPGDVDPDEDDGEDQYLTQPLPASPPRPPRDRMGRRQTW